jgi:hypothetical protein
VEEVYKSRSASNTDTDVTICSSEDFKILASLCLDRMVRPKALYAQLGYIKRVLETEVVEAQRSCLEELGAFVTVLDRMHSQDAGGALERGHL